MRLSLRPDSHAPASCIRRAVGRAGSFGLRRPASALCRGSGDTRSGLRTRCADVRRAAARVLCAAPRRPGVPVAATFQDGPYTLDSGDKLRVVVFGQDTLSNNYTVDAQGQINMPLIGGGRRAGSPRRSLPRHHQPPEGELHPRSERGGGDRGLPAVLRARRGDVSRAVSLRAEHDGRERDRDRRRLHAARLQGQGHDHAEGARAAARFKLPLRNPVRPGDTITVGERWF